MLNFRRFCNSPKPTFALLSIKPRFALAIFAGQKRFEFRRNVFGQHVQIVLVYATEPVGRVVGEFDVVSTIRKPVSELWEHTRSCAGIDEDIFLQYFKGKDYGYAIEVGAVRLYDKPFSPSVYLGVRPPQSFRYIDQGKLSAIDRYVTKIQAGPDQPPAAAMATLRCLATGQS